MDLRSPTAFWPLRDGLLATYPPLTEDTECDVLVIGAGITGALVADRLTQSGASVVVLDRRDAAEGSTAASTALLQYEIDTPLLELRKKAPPAHADRAYRMGVEAIETLAKRCETLGEDVGFRLVESLHLAHDADAADRLRDEAAARTAIGIDATFLDGDATAAHCGVLCPGAIRSTVAAQVDPFALTHALLRDAAQRGARVFDQTEVLDRRLDGDALIVTTDRERTVRCRHVVYATGYEAQHLLKQRGVKLTSTFAIATEPIDDLGPLGEGRVLWTTEEPYFYARVTNDKRIIAGGEDVPFRNATARDRMVEHKAQQIERHLRRWLHWLNFERRYAWGGTFSSTKDGLAFIGPHADHPRCFFALGYGGNGVTYSVMAAGILDDLVHGRGNPDAGIFRFGR